MTGWGTVFIVIVDYEPNGSKMSIIGFVWLLRTATAFSLEHYTFLFYFSKPKTMDKKHILQNTGINSTLKLPEINGKRDFTFDLY